jgi:sporulation protein YlmC with PRC-barrel domain
MQRTIGSRPRGAIGERRPARFARIWSRENGEAVGLLLGCQVVTSEGERIGRVDHLMVDVVTHQLRYVMIKRRNSALVAIPWQALYYDAANSRLVFYTWL